MCTITTWKSIPMDIWCFMAMCFHFNVYKQQDLSRFIVKLCSKNNKLWQIDKLDVVLLKMGETGVLDVGGWSFTKARCPCPWGTLESCLQDVEPIPNDWKCLAGPRRMSETFNDSIPGLIYCPSGQAPTVLERYDLT
jgi:hypothetical protein